MRGQGYSECREVQLRATRGWGGTRPSRWYTDPRNGLRHSFDEALKCGDVPEEMRTRVGAGYLWRSELIHEDTARSRSLAVT